MIIRLLLSFILITSMALILSSQRFALDTKIPYLNKLGTANLKWVRAQSINCFVITSGSMQPTITKNALIIDKKTGQIRPGDIITYKYKNQERFIITHRVVRTIIKSNKSFYITKGDANNYEDTIPVTEDEIIGKVVLNIPKFIYLLTFMYMLFFIISGLLLGTHIFKLISYIY